MGSMSETTIVWGDGAAAPGTKNFIKPVSSVEVVATTLPAGTQATASVEGGDTSPLFRFGVPKGDQGEPGEKGRDGANVLPTDEAVEESMANRLPILLSEQPMTGALGSHAGVLQRQGDAVLTVNARTVAWSDFTAAFLAPKGVVRFLRIPAGSIGLPDAKGQLRLDLLTVTPAGVTHLVEGAPTNDAPVHAKVPDGEVPFATATTAKDGTVTATGGLWVTTSGNIIMLRANIEQNLQEEFDLWGGTIAQLPNNQLSRWTGTEWLPLSKNDGSLHKVAHDDTLLGDGTDHSPLAVADPGNQAEIDQIRTMAEEAGKDAETAAATAQQASDTANTALQTASGIEATATGAMDAANAARTTASDAETAANAAASTATDAKSTADGLSARVDDASRDAKDAATKATDAASAAKTATTTATDAASKIDATKSMAEDSKARLARLPLIRWGSASTPSNNGASGVRFDLTFNPPFGFPPVIVANAGGGGRIAVRVDAVTQNRATLTAWQDTNFGGETVSIQWAAFGNWDK